ncbi:hypothetical protein [Pedobacter glucosidilyticus]|uniref:hypothetical protein n=1 Tax=Pedobacter glucosidilyticus TaxID=1122941 RepID=UPI0004030A16|nr:hypothetical protein [Pedobacter glucosidilyticus]
MIASKTIKKHYIKSLTFLVLILCSVLSFGFQPTVKLNPQLKLYDSLVSRYRYFKPDTALYFVNRGLELANRLNDDNGKAMMLN